ncbi:MAG: M48 family metalloprotease [Deltaproteobacteria bacterium]|nr:M48 family metalloprotease [Deltaproteobacteria bacterium]
MSVPRCLLPLLAVSLAWVPSAHAQFGGYEELANTTALTAADDYRIGKGYFDMMKWLQGSLDDPQVLAATDGLLRRIVASSDRPSQNINFLVVPTDEINAAALPGGFLMINKGIIDAMPEDQLAFVLGHEVAHVQLRHFATTMNMTSAMEVLSLAEGGREADDRSIAEAQTQALEKMARSYARNLELEADLYGMLYAMRAGYPAASGVEAMHTMKRLVGETPPGMEDLANHPSFSERIEQLEKGLATIEDTYGLFEAGVTFARQAEYDGAISAFEQFLALFPKSAAGWTNLGACYLKKAIASSDDPWHDDVPVYLKADVTVRAIDTMSLGRARDALSKALAIDPNRDAALGALAVLARHEGDYKGSSDLLAKALALDPDYAGYHNNAGVLAAAQGKWKDADKAYAKALKNDPSAMYVKVNQAVQKGAKGEKKAAIALWRELESVPQFATRASKELTTLGEEPVVAVAVEAKREAELTLLGAMDSGGSGDVFGGGYEAPAEPVPVDRPPAPQAPSGRDANFGAVSLGMNLPAVKAGLGTPDIEEVMEDGYYAYLQWFEQGISATFVDDVASGFEVFDPGQTKTGRGIGRGSSRTELLEAYGEPEYRFEDPEWDLETIMYESVGVAFYLDGTKKVTALSIWSSGF